MGLRYRSARHADAGGDNDHDGRPAWVVDVVAWAWVAPHLVLPLPDRPIRPPWHWQSAGRYCPRSIIGSPGSGAGCRWSHGRLRP